MATSGEARAKVATAVFWTAVADAFKTLAEHAREEAIAAAYDGDHEKLTALDVSGHQLGSLTKSADRIVYEVDNWPDMLAWLERVHPDAITKSANPFYIKKLIDQAEKGDIPHDPDTGEVCPHIVEAKRPGTYRLTKTNTARNRVKELLASMGQLPGGFELPAYARALLDKEN